jgi:GxxExxY protein
MIEDGMNAEAQRRRGREEKGRRIAMPYEDEEPPYVEPDPEIDRWTSAIIGAALEVNNKLGVGLDEALYQAALRVEFDLRGIPYAIEPEFDVDYKGHTIGKKRLDFLVAGLVIVELKAVECVLPLHKAQLRTYLKIARRRVGLLINFNCYPLKTGIHRIINPSPS